MVTYLQGTSQQLLKQNKATVAVLMKLCYMPESWLGLTVLQAL